MATAPVFNAADWIAHNTYGGTQLTPEATGAVASFTMMWNLFEDLVCHNDASVNGFEHLAASCDTSHLPDAMLIELENCLAFWSFRYRTPQGFSDRFLGLNFRRNDRQDLVESVLLGERSEVRDKLFALMIIVYRLRNNLFHGIKTVAMLNDQVPNLNTASRCLGMLMHLAQSNLIRHVPARRSQGPRSAPPA